MNIITNNVPRFTLDWSDLTDKERAEFTYLDTEQRQLDALFMRYKGWTYDLGEFMGTALAGWDGIAVDTFFSGVLVRFVDSESVIVGRVYS